MVMHNSLRTLILPPGSTALNITSYIIFQYIYTQNLLLNEQIATLTVLVPSQSVGLMVHTHDLIGWPK